MRAQLRTALTDALADDAVRVVVLDHTGRVFCSGMDLSEAAGGAPGRPGRPRVPRAAASSIWSSPKPVVAVVRGPARAGGVGPGRRLRRRGRGVVGHLRLLRGAARAGAGGHLRGRAAADGAARGAPADAHRRGVRRRHRRGGRAGRPGRGARRRRRRRRRRPADRAGRRARPRRWPRPSGCCAPAPAGPGVRRRCSSCRPGSSPARRARRASPPFREKRPARWVPTAD